MWTSSMIPSVVPVGLAAQEGEDMLVYCAITQDRYEHIAFVADMGIDLAKILGVKPDTLYSHMHRNQACKGYKIEKVEIDDEGEN